MNLDELVKNVVSADQETLPLQNPSSSTSSSSCSSSSSSSSSVSNFFGNFNLNGTLCRKTVHHHHHHQQQQQQQLGDLGETTLEDFLVRAGVVNVGNQENFVSPQPLMSIDPMVVVSQQPDWFKFPMASVVSQDHHHQQMTMPMVGSNFQVSEMGFERAVEFIGQSENKLEFPMGMTMVPSNYNQVGLQRKNSFADEMKEKTIERRQRRMIKNRESAARSRARKQAYTNQLEHEVIQLRKTNSWLKKQKKFPMLNLKDDNGLLFRELVDSRA